MKKTLTILTIALGIFSTSAQNRQAENTTSNMTLPSQKFDPIVAQTALAEGTGKIKGVAFTNPLISSGDRDWSRLKASNVTVYLMPLTPYFQEYYRLLGDKTKNNPKKNKYVGIHDEAAKYQLSVVANNDGEFTFPKMKPGKYYLYAVVKFEQDYVKNEYAGSGYNGYGGRTDYYTPRTTTYSFADLISDVVEIKKDGQVVKAVVKRR